MILPLVMPNQYNRALSQGHCPQTTCMNNCTYRKKIHYVVDKIFLFSQTTFPPIIHPHNSTQQTHSLPSRPSSIYLSIYLPQLHRTPLSFNQKKISLPSSLASENPVSIQLTHHPTKAVKARLLAPVWASLYQPHPFLPCFAFFSFLFSFLFYLLSSVFIDD